METLGDARTTLRAFILRAEASNASPTPQTARLRGNQCRELKRFLHHTIVYHYYTKSPAYPRHPWSSLRSLALSEVIALVIERLLTRRRIDADDSNLLTLGYREVAPGSNGHRVASTNSVMCYYPNTLVATLKTPMWEQLHQLIGDDLLVHLLLNYCVFVKLPEPVSSYIQIAGSSLRWLKSTTSASTVRLPPPQKTTRKRKRSETESTRRDYEANVSINQVMYARHFKKRGVFAKSTLAMSAASHEPGEAVSRGRASTLLRSFFPEIEHEKRLPKRLVNLVPIAQDLLQRCHATDVDAMIAKMLPAPAGLREFMREHGHVRHALAATREVSASGKSPAAPSLVSRIEDEGYVSQPESPTTKQNRKRKRREGAIEALSTASASASAGEPSGREKKKRVRFQQNDQAASVNEVEPMLGVDQLAQLQRHRHEIAQLLQFTVPKKQVQRVVIKVLARILPKELWGKPHARGHKSRATNTNWTKLKSFVKRLVFLKKFDSVSLDAVAATFRVKDIEWMDASGKSKCPPNELRKRHTMVANLLKWTTHNVVYPLLRNCFYITECEGSANEIFYYPRSVWTIISSLALYDLTSFILKPVSSSESSLASRQLASSRLRLLPKVNGVRPLMNLSGKGLGADHSQSVNRSLELVHRALLFEIDRQAQRLLGSTVRNVDEIYDHVKTLFQGIQQCPHCTHSTRRPQRLYCVTVDVERCFDTIRPKKLLRILKKVFLEDEYLVRKHWVCKGTHFKMQRPAFPSGDLRGFEQLIQESSTKRDDAVFVDGVLYDYVTKAKILTLLREHLTANTVQANDQVFVQRQGIPQGSVLSTTLCNLYYANFERRVLHKQLGDTATTTQSCQHELLMRYTDDFLFISTDLAKARRFAELMHRGNEEFGCFVNPTKSRVNFHVTVVNGDGSLRAIPRFDERVVDTAGDAATYSGSLAWCGLLIDPMAMQIYANYDKLSLSVVAASLPIDDSKKVSAVFVNKVLSAIRQRWHRLYFGSDLLQPSTIQLLCLAALRFVLLVDKLPTTLSPSFLHRCIAKILMKSARGIQRTLLTGKPTAVLHGQIWAVGVRCFIDVITGTKLERNKDASVASVGSTLHTSSPRNKDPTHTSRRLWELVIQLIRHDAVKHTTTIIAPTLLRSTQPAMSNASSSIIIIIASGAGVSSDANENTMDLDTLQRHPRNAVVTRWLAAYRKQGNSAVAHARRQRSQSQPQQASLTRRSGDVTSNPPHA